MLKRILFLLLILGGGYWLITNYNVNSVSDLTGAIPETVDRLAIETLVENHAKAWEIYDEELFLSTIHDEIVFAYPGRRLNKEELIEDYRLFHESFTDTKIYIHEIIIDGEDVAVEWQFATTRNETGKREAVSDGIIGKVRDGKIVVWKEYLDGRVTRMQARDALPLQEGEEPFPSPGSLRNYCEVACTPIPN